jgi:TyrR family helix-turn-helix protein
LSNPGEIVTLSVAVDKVERQLIEKAYRQYRNTRQMAKALGVHQSTFLRKATKYGITKK